MKIDQQLRFIVIHKQADSLYSLIADGQYRATPLSRDKWKELIGSPGSLPENCNKEGFNVVCSWRVYSKAKIGIVSNGGNECDSCDSRIGFGTGGSADDLNTCGNEAGVSPDNGYKHWFGFWHPSHQLKSPKPFLSYSQNPLYSTRIKQLKSG